MTLLRPQAAISPIASICRPHLRSNLSADGPSRSLYALSGRYGFTLVEVLVAIAIIGMLVALSIPAVQMARESSRRVSCTNKLKQLALGVKLHEGAHRTFPTGGWGSEWVGDPDSGFALRQPGGWVYNTLPFVEEEGLRSLGSGLPETSKKEAIAKLMGTPLELLVCPSRRLAREYPYNGPRALQNASPPQKVAKTDYAINGKISFERSEVILSEIQLADGLSKTVLLGEKSLPAGTYTTGQSEGDSLSMYQGDCADIARSTSIPLANDKSSNAGFGSAHPVGCLVAYCDGAVKLVPYGEAL